MQRVFMRSTFSIKRITRFSQDFVNEVMIEIQERGGVIISVSISPLKQIFERLLVVYEDNDEDIEPYLQALNYEGPEDD